jgi:3-hydroxymyristoyl/3-hydroxydecanoyl-(acyl carrier protein) dehydratase
MELTTALPEIKQRSLTEHQARITMCIPGDLKYLKGHFPHTPIVPGVVLVHWVKIFAQELFSNIGNIVQIKNLKFSTIMQPHAQVILNLEHNILQA